ncbi:aldo/keto reductase [Limibaculum sp. M0105]|uniref:Aldo/keto reductase n=1 Tax=Thermohalobaculum xanthum TaxID=2753746 RepID=A0A8J7M6L6_9RHOB|nr:aldo/keto reductase [Thermohalobaculum xanthum]MBK0398484.1 aldo/keto reductase [Thermohalobaculum xanthum]
MSLSRRTLLAGGVAAAATLSLFRRGQATDPSAEATRAIPMTGERIPVIGLGSWITFNVGRDPVLLERCAQVIEAFAEEGGGMIDSSPMYGSSQDTIGHGLTRLRDPSVVFSAEKVWTSSPRQGPNQIAETGDKWGIDKFDLLQVHNLQGWRGNLETLYAMKAEGRLRYVGVTTSHGRRHELLEQIMREEPIDFVQLTYNVQDREAEARLLPLAQERGIGVIVNRPYRRGALVRRFQGAPLPAWTEEIGAQTWPQLLLKFIISHPAVTVVIPATRQMAHLRENKAAARGPLPDDALRRRMAADIADL